MKRWYYIAIATISITLLTALVSIMKYNDFLSEKSLHNITGTQENYAWSIAKLAIQINEYHALTNTLSSIDELKFKLDLLFSRLNSIRNQSESTTPLYSQQGYKESVDSIFQGLNTIDQRFFSTEPDMERVEADIVKLKPMVKYLINLADHAEGRQRTHALLDYKKKRKYLWVLLAITEVLLATLLVVLVFFIHKCHRLLVSEKAAFASKNAFLGVVGHELRTSLQAIISAIDVVTNIPSEKIRQEQLQRLVMAVAKMERQMKDLAEFAKIDNGYIDIKNTYFRLKPAITESVENCISIYNKKNIKVIINNKTDIIIFTDAVRLNQLVENLVSNAIKYTDKGKVEITYLIEKSKWLVIIVSDTGKGIPKDKLKYIFKPFIRLGDNQKPVPGFGMGLAIVNGILRVLKGSVQIQSTMATGTRITLRIPVKMGAEDLIDDSTPQMIMPSEATRDIRVLVVDDNEMACAALTTLLTTFGYILDSATTPERAYEKLLRKSYDIVLSDLQMPVMTGAELFHAVRKVPNPNRSTPFIFVSAYSDESPVVNVPLLTKPVRFHEIRRTINSLLLP